MAVEKRGLKINVFLIVIGGILMTMVSILAFLLVVRGVYGNFTLSEVLPTKENITNINSAHGKKVAVLYSKYTENSLEEGSTWLSDNIATWERYIKSKNLNYDLIDDHVIEYEDLSEYKILFLPSSFSLSDREVIKIKQFLENGGSIFASKGIGTFSDEAKWRGWEFFSEVFGLKFTKEIHPEDFKTKIHTLRGNLPITAGIPAGFTFNIATWGRPIYVEILDPRVTQVSYWYDYRLENGLVEEEIKKSAGIVNGTYGKGRFVWLGFELNSVFGNQENYINLDKLFGNCVNWLTYNPTAYVQSWPNSHKAAAIFVPTIEENPQNVRNLLPILGGKKTCPATLFVSPYVIERNPKLIRELTKYGDIGSLADLELLKIDYDTTASVKDKKEIQDSILKILEYKTKKAIGKKSVGILPKYGKYDEFTLQAMADNNMEFLLSDSLTDRSEPNLQIRNAKSIMLLSKTVRDDKVIIGDYNLTNTDFQKFTYEEDIDRILFEGGLYVFKIHSSLQMRKEYVSVVKNILNYIKEKKLWTPTLKELKKWWLINNAVEFKYEVRSSRRIAIEISNPNNKDKNDFTVQIDMNKKIKNIEISSDIIFEKLPKYEFDDKKNVLYLYIKNLEEGETRSYLIDFENV